MLVVCVNFSPLEKTQRRGLSGHRSLVLGVRGGAEATRGLCESASMPDLPTGSKTFLFTDIERSTECTGRCGRTPEIAGLDSAGTLLRNKLGVEGARAVIEPGRELDLASLIELAKGQRSTDPG